LCRKSPIAFLANFLIISRYTCEDSGNCFHSSEKVELKEVEPPPMTSRDSQGNPSAEYQIAFRLLNYTAHSPQLKVLSDENGGPSKLMSGTFERIAPAQIEKEFTE
jgi:hypothetical protein